MKQPRIKCESGDGYVDFDGGPAYWDCAKPATHRVKPGPKSYPANWYGVRSLRMCANHASEAPVEGDRAYRFRNVR